MKAREANGQIDAAQTKRYRKGDYEVSGLDVTTLKGAPTKVFDSYTCSNNHGLTNLEYGPVTVGKDFMCDTNSRLTSLVGAPVEVGMDVNILSCGSLTSLEGFPAKVGTKGYMAGTVRIKKCPVRSLEHLPKHVPGSFWCIETDVTTLKGGPESVGSYCSFYRNDSLDSLRYLPRVGTVDRSGKLIVNKCVRISGYLLAFVTGTPNVTITIEDRKREIIMPADANTIFRAKLHLVLTGHKDIAFIQ